MRHAIADTVTVLALTVLAYLLLVCVPAVTHGMFDPPAQNNGYSPYTMFQRCHAAQFHIPDTGCQ
jgi:hypothetical protein